MLVAASACSGDESESPSGDAATPGSSSGQNAASSGQAGASSGQNGASSGQASSSSSSGETGSSSSSGQMGSSSSGEPAAFTLHSDAFAEGAKIPCNHVASFCVPQGQTSQQSPPFSWTEGPSGTQSYALVMRDDTVSNVHWVLYDIPADVRSLPLAVQRGPRSPAVPAESKQSQPPSSFGDPSFGYFGPCPVAGPAAHTYSFTLYARPTTQEAGASEGSTVDQLAALVSTGALGETRWTGTQDAKAGQCSN